MGWVKNLTKFLLDHKMNSILRLYFQSLNVVCNPILTKPKPKPKEEPPKDEKKDEQKAAEGDVPPTEQPNATAEQNTEEASMPSVDKADMELD